MEAAIAELRRLRHQAWVHMGDARRKLGSFVRFADMGSTVLEARFVLSIQPMCIL